MPTRNLVLTDHQDEFVDRLVKSGRFQNASEVLRHGLRLVEAQDAEEHARLKALREAARMGVADIEAGRFSTFTSASKLASDLLGSAEKRVKARAPKSQ